MVEGGDALKVEMYTWGSFRRVYAEAWYIDNVSVEDVEATLRNNIPNATIEIL